MERVYGLEIPESMADACRSDRTALIVYDMQVGILSQMTNAAEIVQAVSRVLSAARKAGLRVFFMRHRSLPKEASGVFQLRMAKAWQRATSVDDVHPWFLPGTPGFELTPELEVRSNEVVFDKIAMSAFAGTPLDIALRDCAINSFIIVGIATEIGIEPTVRHGSDLGYIPIVVSDACGAGDIEAGERTLANMEHMGDAFTTEELSAVLETGD